MNGRLENGSKKAGIGLGEHPDAKANSIRLKSIFLDCWNVIPIPGFKFFKRIQEKGFEGGYTIVNDYIRIVRPPKVKAFLKLDFAPGECAQVDWGSYGSIRVGETSRRLSFFVMVLCHSRMMYVEFTVSQTMEHFLSCHQNAFDRLGVPEKIMVDNLKSAVLRRITGQDPTLNPKYVDFGKALRLSYYPMCGG